VQVACTSLIQLTLHTFEGRPGNGSLVSNLEPMKWFQSLPFKCNLYRYSVGKELLSMVPQQHISDDYRGGAVQVVLS
jgi:hypothetical protein